MYENICMKVLRSGRGLFVLVCLFVCVCLAGGGGQRVLNDLWRTRLSRCRMIWFLTPHPSPTSPVSKLSLFLSFLVCRRSSIHRKKKVRKFPIPSRDVTTKNLPGRE